MSYIDEAKMSAHTMSQQDHARYIKHLPVEAIEHLGEVKESSPTPAANPFESDQAPYQLDPASFEDDQEIDRQSSAIDAAMLRAEQDEYEVGR